jgi:hypothetical protein
VNKMAVCVASVLVVAACSSPPAAVELYTRQILPARNAGAYATLIPELRGSLVLEDATAACSVAVADGAKEQTDPACVCAHSSQTDWQQRCLAWFQSSDAGTPSQPPVATGLDGGH